MAKIGYARVSSRDQHLEMQLSALSQQGCGRIFQEKRSGVRARPELDACMDYLREGDTLVVYKLDRLGRSLSDLVRICGELRAKGVLLVSVKDNIDQSTPGGKMMMAMMMVMAEFERDLIVERTTAGRKAAMARGVKFGRKDGIPKGKAAKCATLYREGHTVPEIMEFLGVGSKSTVYRWLRHSGIQPDRR